LFVGGGDLAPFKVLYPRLIWQNPFFCVFHCCLPFRYFLKVSLRDANLSKTQNYHPSQRKSIRFWAKRYENQHPPAVCHTQYAILRSLPPMLAYLLFCRGLHPSPLTPLTHSHTLTHKQSLSPQLPIIF